MRSSPCRCAWRHSRSEPPPLPKLTLETYPPAARAAIARAYTAATARPSDPGAVAALAKTLHAWEQWEGAQQTYLRCQALAQKTPTTLKMECHHLDAIVLR